MPGRNCAVVGCGKSRRTPNLGIFKLPKAINENYTVWRREWLEILLKTRVEDANFKRQIEADTVYTCEHHFKEEDIDIFPSEKSADKKRLVFGAVPTLNLPTKSHVTTSERTPKRKPPTERLLPNLSEIKKKRDEYHYHSFDELCTRLPKLKLLKPWACYIKEDRIILQKHEVPYVEPKYEIQIDDSMGFAVSILGWMLPDSHDIYKNYRRCIRNVNILNLVTEIQNFHLCTGITSLDSSTMHPVRIHADHLFDDRPINFQIFHRHIDCEVLTPNEKCEKCSFNFDLLEKSLHRQKKRFNVPAAVKAPVSITSPQRLVLTLQHQRLKCKQLEEKIEQMKTAIKSSSIDVDSDMSNDLISIFSKAHSKHITPFMNLFWQQQQKLFQNSSSTGNRFHPMIIRFCLSLASRSSSCYEELRNSGIVRLPSQRTLRDYRNYIKPKPGFDKKVIEELIEQSNDYFDVERYIAVLFDEMKLRSNLVFDKSTNQLIGFVDLGDPCLNYSSLEEGDDLGSHILVFLLRGLCTNLKFPLAYFITHNMKAYEIMSLFWDAIFILEKTVNLWVISATGDGASTNRTFFRLHKEANSNDTTSEFCYCTVNLWAPHRFIYFISDVPHLMKTLRNCLYHSTFGKSSRLLWNNGQHLVWEHICKVYYRDIETELRAIPKLTMEHIKINSYSSMRVYLAAQVLSSTVSILLSHYGGNECLETAKYCKLADSFFDCFNVRHPDEGKYKNKQYKHPFTDQNDERFSWLLTDFLGYFDAWKDAVYDRGEDGDFTKSERAKMFITWQTYEGLHITTNSIIEATKFLLSEGMAYVLTERFCQDPVEQYFGNVRGFGRRNDNPDAYEVGYFNNIIRVQRSISCDSGNTKGRYDNKNNWVEITDEKLPKRVSEKKDKIDF